MSQSRLCRFVSVTTYFSETARFCNSREENQTRLFDFFGQASFIWARD